MTNPRPIEERLREYRDINLAMIDQVEMLVAALFATHDPDDLVGRDVLTGLRANTDLLRHVADDITHILDGEELVITATEVRL